MEIKDIKDVKKLIISFFVFSSTSLMLSGCIEPVMSCAGIKTYPRCAKFCTHDAVATCEASVHESISRSINQPSFYDQYNKP